jgi:hypothetical protein
MNWLESLEMTRQEHETLVFDGEVMFIEQGEYGAVLLNREAFYFYGLVCPDHAH